MTPDRLTALDLAADAPRTHLGAVRDEDWAAATPCTDWDVRYLVAHVVGGNRFASMVLDGRTAAEAVDAVMGTAQVGADPLGDFDTSIAAQRLRFRRMRPSTGRSATRSAPSPPSASSACGSSTSPPSTVGPGRGDRRRRRPRPGASGGRPPDRGPRGTGHGLRHRTMR